MGPQTQIMLTDLIFDQHDQPSLKFRTHTGPQTQIMLTDLIFDQHDQRSLKF